MLLALPVCEGVKTFCSELRFKGCHKQPSYYTDKSALGPSLPAIKFWHWGLVCCRSWAAGLVVPPVPPSAASLPSPDGHRLVVPLQIHGPRWGARGAAQVSQPDNVGWQG